MSVLLGRCALYGPVLASGVLALAAAAGCSPSESPVTCEESIRCSMPASPSVPLPDDDDLRDSFAQYSGLTIPEDAADVEITADHSELNELYYTASFTVDRAGLEEFCDSADLRLRYSPDPPDAETRSTYDITENTVDGSAECGGTHPENGRVQRNVVAVFPDDGTAAVYANIVKWPNG